ncbi:MAG: hypothetical protein ACP5NI_06325 [Acetobacteraceae bacterium]
MSESEDPAVAAARLEAALERLEQIAAASAARASAPAAPAAHAIPAAAFAGRLDALIARLRAGLAAGAETGER